MSKIALLRTKSFLVLFTVTLLLGLGLAFAIDSDNDGMSDLYENLFKLNASDESDALLHDDSDDLNNLQESERWTDPFSPDTDLDGWPDHADSNALSRAVFMWGHPDFTDGDEYAYSGPKWMVRGEKSGGSWTSDAWTVYSNEVPASLYVTVDRNHLNQNCVMDLWLEDTADSTVQIQLLNADDTVAVGNIVTDLTSGTATQVFKRVVIPFADHAAASKIVIHVPQADTGFSLNFSSIYIDEDGDGLDVDQEAQLGTLDSKADTDDDGLNDFAEVMIAGANPLSADTDGDGLSDAEEVAAGTNPLVSDSDGDGLSDRAELAQVYQLVETPMLWPKAKIFAEECGGYLAVITSEDELLEVAANIADVKIAGLWLGASDEIEEGVWQWVNGELFDYMHWATNQPNNLKGKQNYLRFSTTSLQWDDAYSTSKTSLLIEYDQGLDPLNPDTDGDGISDGDEVNVYGSNGHYADTDGDGLSDAEEAHLGLNLSHNDTDRDGISDPDEIEAGLDPLNPDSDNDGLNDGDEVRQVYQLIDMQMTWPEAKVFAEESGGYLAVLTSYEEICEVKTVCTNTQTIHPWIGATDIEEEGVWKWVNGEAFEYTRWDRNAPNNYKESQMYLRLLNKALRWDDTYSTTKTSLLIEYDQGLDPLNPDTDGDGISDGDEVNVYGSDGHYTDTDHDGLSDADEVAQGLNPAQADSDGDMIPDALEFEMGLDPLNPDVDNDGLKDGYELAHRYKLVATQMTWPEAKLFAESQNGYLATITSQDELALILATVRGVLSVSPWLGAEEVEEGVWQWVTGETFEYTNWGAGQPNNWNEPQMYLRFLPRRQEWDDAGPTKTIGVLIEYDQGLDPLDPDTDDDGILDGDEVYLYYSDGRAIDSDGDGISDGDEVAAGLNLIFVDSDGDGVNDADEIAAGLNPVTADTDGDGIIENIELTITRTDPLNADSNTNGVADLIVMQTINGADYVTCFDSHSSATWSKTGTVAMVTAVNHDPWVSYQITVEEAGMYHLALHTEGYAYKGLCLNEIEVNIEIDGCDVGLAQYSIVNGSTQYSLITPWLTLGSHLIKVNLINQAREKEVFSVNALELGMIDGVDADHDGVDDWMNTVLVQGIDSDSDGVSDYDEITLHGSNPLDADTDGDGLNDGDELAAGADPLDTDSDDDGVSDGAEVHESRTNPLVAEFDGTINNVVVVSGTQFATNHTGDVQIQGTEARIKPMRGSLEYVVDVPQSDLYRLSISAAHEWLSENRPDKSRLEIYLDGLYVGTKVLDTTSKTFEDVLLFLPWLPQGQHSIVVAWDNYDNNCALMVRELRLQELGGPDADGNGIKDWVECYFDAVTGVDPMPESFVSPACIEGDALYVECMSLTGGTTSASSAVDGNIALPQQGAGPRWYANLPLAENGTTEAEASFQNGGIIRDISVEWVELDLVEHNGEELLVRVGDSVKFSSDNLPFTLTVGPDSYPSTSGAPLIVAFDEAGTYAVSDGTAAVSVNVVGGAFPAENPACMPNRTRNWLCPGLPTNIVVEADDTVELIQGIEIAEGWETNATLHAPCPLLTLTASQTLGEHWIVARLYDGGPILDNIRLDICWSGTIDGYAYGVAHYDDMSVWEFTLTARNLPPGVTLVIESIVAGVVFADGFGTSRTITAADFDEQGNFTYQLAVPRGVNTAACHTIKMYQDGVYIGTAYSAGEFEPGS